MTRHFRAAAVVLTLAGWLGAGTTGGGSGAALGPIIPITPDKVTPAPSEGRHPVVSGRGEVVGVVVDTSEESGPGVAVTEFDTDVPAKQRVGRGVAVSGDGCVAVITDHIEDDSEPQLLVTDRCGGDGTNHRVLLETSRVSMSNPVLSHTGQFLAVQVQMGDDTYIARLDLAVEAIDLDSLEDQRMRVPDSFPGDLPQAELGIDISDDGNVVVVTIREPSVDATELHDGDHFVVAWDVRLDDITIVSPLVGGLVVDSSAYPSISGQGQFVAYVSATPPAGLSDSEVGSWVYVRDREKPEPVLVSEPDEVARYTSIASDATQLAYASFGFCSVQIHCQINSKIVVANGQTAGLTGEVHREIVSTTPSGLAVGANAEPSLSGNGRYVAWVSDAVGALLGTDNGGDDVHAVIRRRDAGLTVDTLDFGEVAPESSTTATAVVRNTGTTTASIDQATTSATPFVVVPGGSCIVGTTNLPPGGSCTIAVRFDSNGLEDLVAASLDVREVGYDPLSASGALRAGVTPTTSSSSSSSSTSSTTSSTPTTTTTTTGERTAVALQANPNPLEFGVVLVGIPSAPSTVTVENTGNSPGTPSMTIGGEHAGDFHIVNESCSARELAPGAVCTIEVMTHPTGGGRRAAALTVRAGDTSIEVGLRAEAHYQPRLVASPATVTEREVAMIVGQGFPPSEEIGIEVGSTNVHVIAHPDELGRFRVPIRPLGELPLGSYVLRVDDRPEFYDGPEAVLVVVLSTFEPRSPTGPMFGSNLIVSRGR